MSARLFKNSFILVLMAAVFLAAPALAKSKNGTAPAQGDAAVAAKIDGVTVSKQAILDAIKNMSVPDSDVEKVYPVVVTQMVNEMLLDREIKNSKIENDEMYKTRLDAMKKQLVKSVYLEKALGSKVTDAAIAKEYDKLKKENEGKKEVHAKHILLKTEEEAKQVVTELDKGAKFEDLAKERSSDPTAKNGGDVGFFAEGEILPEFSKAAFSLKPKEYTKAPVKTQLGWHVIYVEEFRDRKVPELKTVENSIRTKLGQEAIDQMIKDLRAKSKIEMYGFDGKPLASVEAPAPEAAPAVPAPAAAPAEAPAKK